MSDAQVNWNGARVIIEAQNAAERTLISIAHAIEGQAKVNIRQQPVSGHIGLIDTGFYVNSVYANSRQGGSYGETDPSGTYRSRDGAPVERLIAPRRDVPRDVAALVAIGAVYAIHLEETYSPLYRAAETVAKQTKSHVKKVG